MAGKMVQKSPEEISAVVLKHLVNQASSTLGGCHIVGTVITVPASFGDMQRRATEKAAELAGIEARPDATG